MELQQIKELLSGKNLNVNSISEFSDLNYTDNVIIGNINRTKSNSKMYGESFILYANKRPYILGIKNITELINKGKTTFQMDSKQTKITFNI